MENSNKAVPAFKANIDKVGEHLIAATQSIAVAESVTAGNIQAAFSLAKNTTCFFQGGITVYNTGQKCRHLNIDPIHADACNCVSQKIADAMAINTCSLFCSDYGLAITGYASPIPEKSILQLFAYVAIATKGQVLLSSRIDARPENPQLVQMFYTEEAIRLLLGILANKSNPSLKC